MEEEKVPAQLAAIEAQVQAIYKALSNGFQAMDKIRDAAKKAKQFEEVTGKMREAKRLIKNYDVEMKKIELKKDSELGTLLLQKKHALIRELNTYVALRKTFASSVAPTRDLLEGGSHTGSAGNDGVWVASEMSNQQLILTGRKNLDEMDRSIERSKKVVEDTMHIGAETAGTLKAQTEQLGRIVNELDTIQFSIKKAAQMVREIGKQMATDKCIMAFMFLIVCGVVAIIVVKIVQSRKTATATSPSTAPTPTPTGSRRLLLSLLDMEY